MNGGSMRTSGFGGACIAQVVFFLWAGFIWAVSEKTEGFAAIIALAFALVLSGGLKLILLYARVSKRRAAAGLIFLFAADIAMYMALTALCAEYLTPSETLSLGKAFVIVATVIIAVAEVITLAVAASREFGEGKGKGDKKDWRH